MRLVVATVSLVALGACAFGCQERTEEAPQGSSQNVSDLPATTITPKEQNPSVVPTTDKAQVPLTGPSAGTVPNTSPGKNDAPPLNYQTGGEVVPGGAPNADNTKNEVVQRPAETPKRMAEGRLETVDGVKLDGEVELSELSNGVRVYVKVNDAPPGKRGIHIHEKGDCSNIAGKSMGEHFAPTGHKHGLPGAPERHVGDLGNLTIAQDGTGVLDVVVPETNLKPDDRLSLLGKALVIHQSEDLGEGPSGRSGSPIACAVLKQD
jgi:Cu-Zn family superoxide dismutase